MIKYHQDLNRSTTNTGIHHFSMMIRHVDFISCAITLLLNVDRTTVGVQVWPKHSIFQLLLDLMILYAHNSHEVSFNNVHSSTLEPSWKLWKGAFSLSRSSTYVERHLTLHCCCFNSREKKDLDSRHSVLSHTLHPREHTAHTHFNNNNHLP